MDRVGRETIQAAHLRTLKTADIAETFRCGRGHTRNRYAIDLARPLELPERELPIHPYLLGVWLGNGNRGMNRISVHEDDGAEITDRLQSYGVSASFILPTYRKGKVGEIVIDPRVGCPRRCSVTGRFVGNNGDASFTDTLRILHLQGNKFLPPLYLRASVEQRLELLKGLMDTDGHVTCKGRCEFATVLPTLHVGFRDLLASLGLNRPSIRTKRDTMPLLAVP